MRRIPGTDYAIPGTCRISALPQYYWNFLNEIDEEEYHAILKKLLEAKRKSVRAETDYELEGKLVRFALSRGFEMEDIRRCMDLSADNELAE